MLKKYHNQGLCRIGDIWIMSRTAPNGKCELIGVEDHELAGIENRVDYKLELDTDHVGGIDICNNNIVVPTYGGLELYSLTNGKFELISRHRLLQDFYASGITHLGSEIYLIASIINPLGTEVMFSVWNKERCCIEVLK